MKRLLKGYSGNVTLRHWIANDIILSIEKGMFRQNPKLVSINCYSKQKGVSRDTVEKAYAKLKEMGYIKSVRGKGYFVNANVAQKLKVMILLDDLDERTGAFCRELILRIETQAQTEIRLYLHEHSLLKEHIAQGFGLYHYYIVLPSSARKRDLAIEKVLMEIPESQLIRLGAIAGKETSKHSIEMVLNRLAS